MSLRSSQPDLLIVDLTIGQSTGSNLLDRLKREALTHAIPGIRGERGWPIDGGQVYLVTLTTKSVVIVPIKTVWIGRQYPEAPIRDVGAVEIWRGRRDTYIGVARITICSWRCRRYGRRGLGGGTDVDVGGGGTGV